LRILCYGILLRPVIPDFQCKHPFSLTHSETLHGSYSYNLPNIARCKTHYAKSTSLTHPELVEPLLTALLCWKHFNSRT